MLLAYILNNKYFYKSGGPLSRVAHETIPRRTSSFAPRQNAQATKTPERSRKQILSNHTADLYIYVYVLSLCVWYINNSPSFVSLKKRNTIFSLSLTSSIKIIILHSNTFCVFISSASLPTRISKCGNEICVSTRAVCFCYMINKVYTNRYIIIHGQRYPARRVTDYKQ